MSGAANAAHTASRCNVNALADAFHPEGVLLVYSFIHIKSKELSLPGDKVKEHINLGWEGGGRNWLERHQQESAGVPVHRWASFFLKGWAISILSCESQPVSAAPTHLCYPSGPDGAARRVAAVR